jgi:DNA-binding response OmpR family regulator
MQGVPSVAESLLLVDDEEGIRESLAEYLALQGFDITVAGGEAEAWDLAQACPPQVVVSDMNLGRESGLSLLRKFKQAPPAGVEPFCILMTGYGTLDTAIEALRSGVDDLLTKPFSLQELGLALEKARQWRPGNTLSQSRADLRRLEHELSAPMSHMAAYLEMLEQGLFGPLSLPQAGKLATLQLGLRRSLMALTAQRLGGRDAFHRARLELLQPEALFHLVMNEFHLDFERRGVSVLKGLQGALPGVLLDRHGACAAFEAALANLLLRARSGQVFRLQWEHRSPSLVLDLSCGADEGAGDEEALWNDLPSLDSRWLEPAGLALDHWSGHHVRFRFLDPRDAGA